MRVVLQKVSEASVVVDDVLVSKIGKGIMVLCGIDKDDSRVDLEFMVQKILKMRVFQDDDGNYWKKSVTEVDGEVLLVSQFTLLAVTKGSKPDFHSAMGPERSESMYAEFVEMVKAAYLPERVKNGKFGAMMKVGLVNEGPVTLVMDSPPKTQHQLQKEAKLSKRDKTESDASSGVTSPAPSESK